MSVDYGIYYTRTVGRTYRLLSDVSIRRKYRLVSDPGMKSFKYKTSRFRRISLGAIARASVSDENVLPRTTDDVLYTILTQFRSKIVRACARVCIERILTREISSTYG